MKADKTKEQLINELAEVRQENSEIEEKYRFLYEDSPAINVIIGTDGVVKDINDTLIRKYGFTKDDIIGKHVLKFVISNQRKKVAAQIRRDFKGEFTSEIEVDIYAKDRSIHTILFSTGNAILKDKGQLVGILVTGIDITERKKIEKKLIHLSNALKASSDSIVISDLEGKITDVNEATLNMYGTDNKADLIGKSSFDIVAPEDREKAFAGIKEVMEKGYIKDQEYHIVIKDGSKIPVEISTSIMQGSDGEPIGFVGVTRDITDRKQAEEKLNKIIDSTSIPTFVINREHKVTYWNTAVESLTGIKRDEVIGTDKQWKAFYAKKRPVMADLIVYGTAKNEFEKVYGDKCKKSSLIEGAYETFDFFPALGKEGKWLLFTAAPLRDSKGNVVEAIETLQDITEHKLAEEKIKESEEKLRTILNNTNDMVVYTDKHGKILDINKRVEDVLGYKRDELVGKNFAKLGVIGLKSIPGIMKLFQQTVGTGEIVGLVEFEFKDKNGNEISVEANTEFIKKDGKIEGIVTILRDITDRKRAEEAMLKSEAELKAIFNGVKNGIVLSDMTGKILRINKYITDIGGYTEKEIVGKRFNILKMISAKSITKMISVFSKLRKGIDVPPYEIELYSKSGEKKISEISNSFLRKEGKCVRIIAVMKDITERKQAEEALIESEEKYRIIVEMAPDAIGTVNLKGMVTSCNDAFTALTGFSKNEIVGKHFSKLPYMKVKDIPKYLKMFTSLLGGKLPRPFEISWIHKDGSLGLFEVRVGLMKKDNKILGFQAIGRDITERKQAEKKIKAKSLFLESLIQQSPLPTFVMDSKGFVVIVNEAFLKFYAVPNKEMILGRNALTEPANVRQGVIKYFREALSGKIVEMPEIEFVSPHNNKKNITRCRMFPIMDPTGTLTNVVVMQEDITERKRAEEALTWERDLLQALMDNIPDTIYFKDTASRFTRINKAQAQLLGVSDPKEVLGKTDFDFFTEEHARDAYADEQKIIKTGKPLIAKAENIRRADGQFRWVSSTKVLNKDKEGHITGIVGISRDITERKWAEEQLQEQLQELEIYYKATMGREGRVIELKQQVNELLVQLGKDKKYDV